MATGLGEKPSGRSGYRAGTVMIAVTLLACLAALVFRTPLRSRYWAWQVVEARGVAERAAPLTHLCNAGNAGRWGTETLLAHPEPEIRQFGVLVLQHVRSDWSRRRLVQMLTDPDETVTELAALGLAIHGDASCIPELRRLYAGQDALTASAACMALERLATPEAVAAMAALAAQPASVAHRAALVDALAAVGTSDCVAPLLGLLSDHRPCEIATRADRLLERLTPVVAESGFGAVSPAEPASRPATEPASHTIAERAAAALERITGLSPPFASDMRPEQQEGAARVWRDWLARHPGAP
jgi:HEAT repeat protein